MAKYQPERMVYNITSNSGYRLWALVCTLFTEGYTLAGIQNLLAMEYKPEDIDKAYGRRFDLPRCIRQAGE